MHRTGQKNEKEKEPMHEDSRLYCSFYNLAIYTYNNNSASRKNSIKNSLILLLI